MFTYTSTVGNTGSLSNVSRLTSHDQCSFKY